MVINLQRILAQVHHRFHSLLIIQVLSDIPILLCICTVHQEEESGGNVLQFLHTVNSHRSNGGIHFLHTQRPPVHHRFHFLPILILSDIPILPCICIVHQEEENDGNVLQFLH
eukprot:UN24386